MKSFHLPMQTRLSEVQLQTNNLDEALRFYSDVLGFRLIERTPTGAALSLLGAPPAVIRLKSEPIKGPPFSYKLLVPCNEVLYAVQQRAPIFGYEAKREFPWSNALQLIDPQGFSLEIEAPQGDADGRNEACSIDTNNEKPLERKIRHDNNEISLRGRLSNFRSSP